MDSSNRKKENSNEYTWNMGIVNESAPVCLV